MSNLTSSSDHRSPQGRLLPMVIGATGVVFGDIGTSPLYTMKTVLQLGGGRVDAISVLGVLSLLFWTLVIVTTVKYVTIAMRIDNDGEGGILALMALLGTKTHKRPAIVALGLFGAALIYGDGAITPAISVLSALEGLKSATPAIAPHILALAVAILLILFLLQPLGTARIGHAFGPVMLLWFATIAVLGLASLIHHPGVLAAINPLHGLRYLLGHGWQGFLLLGGVFLCVTGAEALYADMSHFGAGPIRLAWIWLIFPSLILNYAGQAALLLDGQPVGDNIFYALCPPPLLLPLIVLATLATIIASQSIITGAFSMTRQAIQLGWLPRVTIRQTSAEGYGQIYVGSVNWLLALATIGITLYFRHSDNLAAAYGIAVSMTMLMTTALLYLAMCEIWGWSRLRAGAVAGLLLLVDGSFFAANSVKLLEGGYVPLLLAALVYLVMWLWHGGIGAMREAVNHSAKPLAELDAMLAKPGITRVPGTAVFLTHTTQDIPPVLLWHVRQNRALREHVIILRVEIAQVPWVSREDGMTIERLAPAMWRISALYGFMESPDVPDTIARCPEEIRPADPGDVTYYIEHGSPVPREDKPRLAAWRRRPFTFMARNSDRISRHLNLPPEQTVEIERAVAI